MNLIFIFLTLFVSVIPVSAQEFIDYKENPVLTKSGTSTAVAQPVVLKEGNTFSIWFADVVENGRVVISKMKSSNGIDWYDKQILNVSNKTTLTDPYIFEENGQFTLYFASSINGSYSIWKSPSDDGETFFPGQEIEVIKSELPWESKNISTPAVIRQHELYYLFYEGNGTVNWSLGLAISTNGIYWQKCQNNPQVLGGGAPEVIQYNNIFYLFFHTSQGIEVQQADSLNGCDTVWTNRHVVSTSFSDPALIVVGNDLWMYGFSNTSKGMSIWLAANTQITRPSYPVVIVPGMFASWNTQALLHNTSVNYDAWKINPGVSEYTALKQTLTNIGRLENKDYFTFTYDWRKPILEVTNDLDQYLTNTFWNINPYQPVQLVGHSLGGVVSRVYADKNPTKPIKQVLTAGSPHQGVVQSFKPLNSGEIERENTLSWIAMKVILFLNKSLFQSNKEAISQKLPVLFDILPVFPFLKDVNGAFIISPLANTLIAQYPIKTSPQINQYYMGGTGIQTLAGYTPTSHWTEEGDGLVLAKSHLNKITPAPVQNHGEIIYTKESIKNILFHMGIVANDNDIADGGATSIFPAIMAFIQSPATIQVEHEGIVTEENEGVIWIKDTEDGNYSLKVTGIGDGEYTISLWLIGENNDQWFQFTKQTVVGKVDEYSIAFNTNSGGSVVENIPPTPTLTPTPTPIIRLSIKPTYKPIPTKIPTPTKKPTPTKVPPSHNDHRFVHLWRIIVRNIINIWRSR